MTILSRTSFKSLMLPIDYPLSSVTITVIAAVRSTALRHIQFARLDKFVNRITNLIKTAITIKQVISLFPPNTKRFSCEGTDRNSIGVTIQGIVLHVVQIRLVLVFHDVPVIDVVLLGVRNLSPCKNSSMSSKAHCGATNVVGVLTNPV